MKRNSYGGFNVRSIEFLLFQSNRVRRIVSVHRKSVRTRPYPSKGRTFFKNNLRSSISDSAIQCAIPYDMKLTPGSPTFV